VIVEGASQSLLVMESPNPLLEAPPPLPPEPPSPAEPPPRRSRVREKLGAAGEYIETVRGVGYRFRADAADEGAKSPPPGAVEQDEQPPRG